MAENITAEMVFDKHAVAHGLPERQADEALDSYVPRVSGKRKELARRLTEAVAAARVGDHVDCARWCAQAIQEVPAER